jgi:NAD-dependent SIR2 family protein deacetylase
MSESAAIPDEFADLVSFAIASQQAATTASAAASSDEAEFARAAELIRSADVLLVGAGAGMGVDSGLPDFRGPEGFWKAYPAFKGKRFGEFFGFAPCACCLTVFTEQMSNPHWFETDPSIAWGFFGHRLHLYRGATPHGGFAILKRWLEEKPDSFVFTSNVDGQFLKAQTVPEEQLVECHGSIMWLQCTDPNCLQPIWQTGDLHVDVDPETIKATSTPLPTCPTCARLARPNILMFGDFSWHEERTAAQEKRFAAWQRRNRQKRVVAVEMGAGLAIPTVRITCEENSAALVRINPREPQVHRDADVALAHGALYALTRIDELLRSS